MGDPILGTLKALALDLRYPHGTLLVAGDKMLVLKTSDFDLAGKTMLIAEGDKLLGEVRLKRPFRFEVSSRFRELKRKHMVEDDELAERFASYDYLWGFPVESVRRFDAPLKFKREAAGERVLLHGPFDVVESEGLSVALEGPADEDDGDLEEGVRQAFGSPGGKKYLAKLIASIMPTHKTYIEPFAGGAAVFFAKEASEKEVLSDNDKDIAAAYKFLSRATDEELEVVRKRDWLATTAALEAAQKLSPRTDAERFYRTVFMRWASNASKGEKLNPLRKGGSSDMPARLTRLRERLRGVTVMAEDFRVVLKANNTEDSFAYLDPPYPGQWYGKGDEVSFAELRAAVDKFRGKWLLSIQDSDEAHQTFKGYTINKVVTPTNMGKWQGERTELLVSNYPVTIPANRKPGGKRVAASVGGPDFGEASPFPFDAEGDGNLVAIHKRGDDVMIFTEAGEDRAADMPEAVAEIRSLAATELVLEAVLDGERLTVHDVSWYLE